MPFPTEQAVSAGGNLLGSIVNAHYQKKAQERANTYNRQMAQYSYSKDLEMWNRQNEYNTPQNQMNRFNEAGLNPNLIYGKGTSGNATTLPKYSTPTMGAKSGAPDLTGVMASYQDARIKSAQHDVLTQQARLTEEKVATESVNRAMKSLLYDWQTKPNLGAPWKGNQFSLWDSKANQQDQRLIASKRANMLASYNWQIAEQNLRLREKDNKYYFWKNAGAGVVNAAGRMLKFGKVGLGKKGVPTTLVNPLKKGGTVKKGFNYWNQANRSFSQRNNPF